MPIEEVEQQYDVVELSRKAVAALSEEREMLFVQTICVISKAKSTEIARIKTESNAGFFGCECNQAAACNDHSDSLSTRTTGRWQKGPFSLNHDVSSARWDVYVGPDE